jgi:hypothetical protein
VLPYFDQPGGVPPEGNSIRGNLIYGEGIVFRQGAQPFVKDIEGNVTMPDASFFNAATGAYKPPPSGPHQLIPLKRSVHGSNQGSLAQYEIAPGEAADSKSAGRTIV